MAARPLGPDRRASLFAWFIAVVHQSLRGGALNLGGNRVGLASGRWRPDLLIGNNELLPEAEFGE